MNDPEPILFDSLIRPAQEAYDDCPCKDHDRAVWAAVDIYLERLGRGRK